MQKRIICVFCVAAAFVVTPIPATGQSIDAKLGDDTTATFVVKDSNDQEIFVLEAKDQATQSPNVIGGHNSNSVTSGAYGATIGGGGHLTGGGNTVTDAHGTVGGGYNNQAGDDAGTTIDRANATVGGGYFNTASGSESTVGGGSNNTASGARSTVAGGYTNSASNLRSTVGGGTFNDASGQYSTVPGGYGNDASGNYSFAAGRLAKADGQGCFVWGDSTNAEVTCGTTNRWVARSVNGVRFYTNSSLTTGVSLGPGDSAWGAVSDRAVKDNFTPVDKREVLEKMAAMPVEEWNLKSQDPSIRHIGPVAQDFNGAFGYGAEERYINTMDATGVTMAAIQGLYEVVKEQKKEIEGLRKKVEELETLAREREAGN